MSDLERRLADALKGVSESHLEEAPHRPGAVQQQVIQRVRRRWGTFVVTTSAVAALVLALAAVSVPRLLASREDGPSDVAQTDDLPEGLQVDAQMSELLDDAGPLCKSFDFQLKEEIEGHLYRPAYCKDRTQNTILLFSFATDQDRRAWVDAGRPSEFSLKKGSPIVIGPTWEARTIDLDLARKVGERLGGVVIQSGLSDAAQLEDLPDGLQVDAQMSELLAAAGPPCRSFDFQLKEEIEGHPYRPVYCKDRTQNTVLLFSFVTKEDRQAWVDAGRPSKFSLKKESPIVVGLTWEAHAIDLELARKVGEKLGGEVIQSQE